MKITTSLSIASSLFLLGVLRAEENEYDMGAIIIRFKDIDMNLFEPRQRDGGIWRLYQGVVVLSALVENFATHEDLILFRSGVALHMPHANNGVWIDLFSKYSMRKKTKISEILGKSNLKKIEKAWGKKGRERLEKLAKECMTERGDEEDESLSLQLPERCLEKTYIAPFMYVMNVANHYVDAYRKNPGSFHLDRIEKEAADIKVITDYERVAMAMLLRTLTTPDLFTPEEEKIIFHAIRLETRTGIEELVELTLEQPCPATWKGSIEKMNYEQLIQALIHKLDTRFPERINK